MKNLYSLTYQYQFGNNTQGFNIFLNANCKHTVVKYFDMKKLITELRNYLTFKTHDYTTFYNRNIYKDDISKHIMYWKDHLTSYECLYKGDENVKIYNEQNDRGFKYAIKDSIVPNVRINICENDRDFEIIPYVEFKEDEHTYIFQVSLWDYNKSTFEIVKDLKGIISECFDENVNYHTCNFIS